MTTPAPLTGRAWQGLGDMVVFLDGPEEARRAMALTPPAAQARPLSDQSRVHFVPVEPSSRSVVIAAAQADSFVYRAGVRRPERCVEF